MGLMDKVRKLRSSRTSFGDRTSTKGIFYNFEDGDNVVRLSGEFIEVRTHFIAPNPKRKDKGICMQEAFKDSESKLAPVINCLDWDIEKEEAKKEKTCPICKLSRIAEQALKEGGLNDSEKQEMQNLVQSARSRRSLKWNVIDRKNPYVLETTSEGEKKVLGFKIATVGMEAWNDIDGIFAQTGFDITDNEKGINICITKSNNGHRVTYGAKAVLKGTSVDVAPLTPEEREMRLHDLKKICGRMTDAEILINSLHSEYRELLDVDGSDETKAEDDFTDTPASPSAVETKPEKDEFTDTEKPESAVDIESYECFGSIDPNHPECKGCDAKEKCAKKTEEKKAEEKKVK